MVVPGLKISNVYRLEEMVREVILIKLDNIRKLDKAINSKLETLEQLKALATKVTVSYSEKVQTSKVSDNSEIICKIMDLQNEINEDIDKLVDGKREQIAKINKIDNITYRTILTHRYINCLTLEEIAVKMEFTYRWICKLHGRAVRALNEI